MARWIERSFMSCGKILKLRADVVEYKCSSCHRWAVIWFGTCKYEFCPNCGEPIENTGRTIEDFERK